MISLHVCLSKSAGVFLVIFFMFSVWLHGFPSCCLCLVITLLRLVPQWLVPQIRYETYIWFRENVMATESDRESFWLSAGCKWDIITSRHRLMYSVRRILKCPYKVTKWLLVVFLLGKCLGDVSISCDGEEIL